MIKDQHLDLLLAAEHTSTDEPAAFYGRYSDKDRQRDSSIEDQFRECQKEAKRLGLFIPAENQFEDRDVRGATESREGLNRLLDMVRTGKADFRDLFIADTSRLARNSSYAPKLRKFFEHHGIRLHFVENGMKSGSTGFDLQHHFQSYIDEQYSQQLGQKVFRGQVGLVEKGYTPSGRCFGYRNEAEEHPFRIGLHGRPEVVGSRKVIHPEEAQIVLDIFEWYASGAGGYLTVARMLNERLVLSPRRAQKNEIRGWNHAAVKTILQNERYRGLVIFGRMRTTRNPETGKIKHKERPRSEWVTHFDPDLQIVPDELWERAQAKRRSLSEQFGSRKAGGLARSTESRKYLFSGLLRCGQCGGSMVMVNGPGPLGSYYCSHARRKLGCTNMQKIRRLSLEQILIERLVSTVRSETTFAKIKGAFMSELSAELRRAEERANTAGSQKAVLDKERRQLEGELENLAEEVALHGGSETLRSLIRRKESRMEGISKKLKDLQRPVRQISEEEIDTFLNSALGGLAQILQGDAVRSKQEIQKRITSLTLTPSFHKGEPVYIVSGDVALFSDEESVLLGSSLDSTTKHHYQIHSLSDLVLKLDSVSDVVAIIEDKLVEVKT